jgi:hypothetical protein
MDFNDSFGPMNNNNEDENENDNEDNKNNNISFEGNKENNNLSFENNANENNENNLSFDNMKMEGKEIKDKIEKEEEKQNDIFNAVPIEIKSEENQDILYYENLLIKQNIKYNLSLIFNNIKKNIYLKKTKFFQELKRRANYKLSKLINAEIMFLNIENKLSIFTHIEKNWKYQSSKKVFLKLKFNSKLDKYKKDQDKIKENEMKKKVKEVNDNLKKTENNLKAVSDSVEQLKQNEKNINNELSELNKKNNKLNEKYNNLVTKSKELKESIMQKMTNFSSTLDKTIDPRIAELQNIIKAKEREKNNNMNYFEEFYKKMNDILDIYENNYETIKSSINSSHSTNI